MDSGVLVVDKPSGPTSHDLVAQARRIFRLRRVGHAGTLDPLASGVMLLLFGEATKLSSYLTLHAKKYRARIAFGRSTDTLDALGGTIAEQPLAPGWLSHEKLHLALEEQRALEEQIPPAFSAIQVRGTRAHRLSRRGEQVELEPRRVRLLDASVVSFDDESLSVDLEVTKGYYVRSFARDLGVTLGVPSHLAALRRTASGCFTLAEAVSWPVSTDSPLLAVAAATQRALPHAVLTESGRLKATQGKVLLELDFASPALDEIARLHDDAAATSLPVAWFSNGGLIALGRRVDGVYRVVRGFSAEVPSPRSTENE